LRLGLAAMELARSVWLALVTVFLGAAPVQIESRRLVAAQGMSPVTRIVGLLEELRNEVEADHKKEEALYEKFVCWAKSVVSQKTMSNAEAEAELGSLQTYVSDLASGRVELTSERVDLEKEIAGLVASLETAEAARKQEHADYGDATAELELGASALKDAIEVLSGATAGHEQGVLLGLRTSVGHTRAVEAQEAATLSRAAQLGDRFLEPGDAVFLRRLLGGEVPEVDWKKLNRKATFKMSYKARSTKIQDVLVKLLAVFEGNLAEAQKKESDSQELYDKLLASKTKERGSAQEALAKMAMEGGAKGQTKAEMEARIDLLGEQIENDKKYMSQVTTSLEDKKTEWQARTAIRSKEIAAISKALEILASDDSKDTFKRSLASQGYLFLQTTLASARDASGAAEAIRAARGAASELRAVARAVNDGRVLLLAERLGDPGAIARVVEAIDTMVGNLRVEQASDEEKKEDCEANRMEDTRSAVQAGRAIDAASDTMTQLASDVGELDSQITQKEEQGAAIVEQLAAAEAQRKDEHVAFLNSQKDDEDAAKMVASAIEVLEAFYKEGGNTVFVQRAGNKEPVEVAAGQAPPPPPKTWSEPEYGGRTSESGGIIMILTMIKDDILKDQAASEKAEEKAGALYTETSEAFTKEKAALDEQVDEMKISSGEKVGTIESTRSERSIKKGELGVLMEKIRAVQPGCDFFQVNYLVRKKSRLIELDGLLKAKAILEGARFDEEDSDREMKPGDAALLVKARHRLQSLETRHGQ